MNQTKLGSVLGAAGAIGGIIYCMKGSKGLGATALYAIIFGVVGVYAGNTITKFYEN